MRDGYGLDLRHKHMSGFLRSFFLGGHGQLPPPDRSVRPKIAGQEVVEVVYSDSQAERAVITNDSSGIYRVHVQFWDTSDWNAGHGAFWNGGDTSITDTVELARN